MKLTAVWTVLGVVVVALLGMAFLYSGCYDIGADAPHIAPTRWILETLRERSIETRAKAIDVPDLGARAQIAEGARHYGEMCAGCHGAPGNEPSEIRKGLYPPAPDLTRAAPDPAQAFWTVKHGIKMSGMAAWGPTHGDRKVWAIVAFLQALPGMSAEEYDALTRGEEHEHEDGHPEAKGG